MTKIYMKNVREITMTYSGFQKFNENPKNSITCLRLRNANVPNERSFQGLFKNCNLSLLSIPETEKNAFKRPEPPSESYTGNT